MLHPFVRQDRPTTIRPKLQGHARNLLIHFHDVMNHIKRVESAEVYELIGELKCYCALRLTLAPEIPLDGYTRELETCIAKVKAAWTLETARRAQNSGPNRLEC